MRLMSVRRYGVLGVLATLVLTSCGDGKQAGPQAAAPPPAVTVIKVATAEVRPTSSFTGRVEAMFKVDLRARIEGFLEKRLFAEGADVKEGDLLLVIEKGLYQAALDQAKGSLETANASLKLADIEVDRQTQLVQRNVAAQVALDQASAKQGEARGEAMTQKAAVDKAELNLSYTEIRAPISGRIGRTSVSVGNYVTPQSNALATIVSQDPIYATFPVTQREVLTVRKGQGAGAAAHYTVYLQLADGSRYAHPGKLNFFDVTVNQGTDTVLVRAEFPNPNRILVDGQLVNVLAELDQGETLLQVPQQALQADQAGTYVLIVDKESKVQVRRVDTGPGVGTNASVKKGLDPGELVVTEGIQKVRPGQVVQATEVKPGS
jgi:membrane fusion protein (multidrug efflux system)